MTLFDRSKFPLRELHYFDSATYTLVPNAVVAELERATETLSGSPRQGAHRIALRTREAVENTRRSFAGFFNAKPSQVIFFPDATAVFSTFALGRTQPTFSVALSELLDHTAILPWFNAKRFRNVKHDFVLHDEQGEVDFDGFEKLIGQDPAMVVVPYFIPVLGTRVPIKKLGDLAHSQGVDVIVDGRTAAGHQKIDVTALGCDAFVCDSNVGLMGPTGISIVIAQDEFLQKFAPFRVGAGSVKSVSRGEFELLPPPEGFEPGVGNVGVLAATQKALKLLETTNLEKIAQHEQKLTKQLSEGLTQMNGVTLYGPPQATQRGPISSFNLHGLDAHDVAIILDETRRVIVRSGTMCNHLLFQKLDIRGAVQISTHLYNNTNEVAELLEHLETIARDLI